MITVLHETLILIICMIINGNIWSNAILSYNIERCDSNLVFYLFINVQHD